MERGRHHVRYPIMDWVYSNVLSCSCPAQRLTSAILGHVSRVSARQKRRASNLDEVMKTSAEGLSTLSAPESKVRLAKNRPAGLAVAASCTTPTQASGGASPAPVPGESCHLPLLTPPDENSPAVFLGTFNRSFRVDQRPIRKIHPDQRHATISPCLANGFRLFP